nr:refilin-B [Vulpes vulpes]
MVGRLSLQDVPELVDTKKKGDGVLDSPDSGLPPSPSPSHWGLAAAGGGGERSAAPGTLDRLPGDHRVGTAWPPRGARGGSAARAGPAGVGGWKMVIAWEAREPPLLGVAAPAAAGLCPPAAAPPKDLPLVAGLGGGALQLPDPDSKWGQPVGTGLEVWRATLPPSQNPAPLPSPLAFACSPRLCPLSFGEGVEFDPLPPTEVRYTSSVKYDSERHFIDDVHLPLGLAVASCSYTVTCLPNCTWRNYKAEVHFKPCHKPTRFLSTTIVYPKYPKTVYTTTLDYNCRKTLRRFLSSVELEATELPGSDGLPDEC